MDRDRLLEMLEGALEGELLPVPSDADIAAEEAELEDEYEPEDDELDEEEFDDEEEEGPEELLEMLPPVLRRSQGLIGPRTSMRTTSKGEEFLFVAATIERWLRNCPLRPLELGPRGALALAPLVCSWSATITHALAAEPLTMDELARIVGHLDHDTVVAHVEPMERSAQVEALPGGGETRYALTEWGREGIAPIVAAVRYELRYPEDDVLPPDVFDVEASFQMALPLVKLPAELRGSCRLGVEVAGEEPMVAGSTVNVERGSVLASTALLDRDPETWATGSPLDWCEDVVNPASGQLQAGGDVDLAVALVQALHERLFGL
jgi:DNA-binding transcriptional ArsR family regulator